MTRERAQELDAADPLGEFRERFAIDDELVYLDGNSLGRLPRATAERLARTVAEEWGGRLIRGWDEGWMELPLTIGDRLGEVALGAGAGPGRDRRLDHGLLLQARLGGARPAPRA